jgi:hypothetical protein
VNHTAQTAKSAPTLKTGLFATLCGFLHATGSGARSRAIRATPRITVCALLALCAAPALALSAAVARAEAPKLTSYGSFASEGPGVAVGQSNGDVFTAGLVAFGTGEGTRIREFDGEGTRISAFGPEGSLYAAAAVSPASGDLYVLNAFGTLETYSPSTGELLSSFAVPASNNFFGSLTVVQIAADSAGNVYVPVVPENEVLEYSPSGTLLNTFKGSGEGALKEPSGVAVDSSGDLWVADTGNERIQELSPTDTPVGEIKSEGVRSVALDGHGDVFALVTNSADPCGSLAEPCVHLVEYSSAGTQLGDVGAGSFGSSEFVGAFNQYLSMLAVNESDGRVYVTDAAKNTVWIFGPPTAPEVTKELTAEVGTTEAKLGAVIKAGGIATSYRFEYGVSTAYGHTTPFPEGTAVGVKAHTVWASASGLAPGTTYHYRVVATNEVGEAVGLDETFTTKTSAEATCPNEQFRGGFSQSLADCRAYELVTPPNSGSAEPDTEQAGNPVSGAPIVMAPGGGVFGNFGARNGERVTYRTAEVMPGAESSGYDYLATRGASGWSSQDLIPLQSYTGDRCTAEPSGNVVKAYAPELTNAVLRIGAGESYGESRITAGCGAQGLEVVPGEPLGVENLLLRDNTTGTYRLINVPPAGVTPTNAHFHGVSADHSHVVFSENTRLTANAPAGVEDLYEWDEGVISLVTILPNGHPVAGSVAQDPGSVSRRSSAISAEGARVFFTAGGNLYVRINGRETTQLDEPRGGSGPGGGGSFQAASADGTQAFFTDDASAGLTSDTVAGSGTNLYRYADGRLSDLTSAEHAQVVGVSGISEDGSYVYFVADGVLSGSQANERRETAQAGRPNMYLAHGGTTTFIATLGGSEDEALQGAVRVSPNGAFLAFGSKHSLTGYDNVDASGTADDPEIFLYSVASDHLDCVSCNPSGEPPSAGRDAFGNESFGGATFAAVRGSVGEGTPHYLTNSGQVFFDTAEALLPRDTNGQIDVYEYENGQLSLISSGTGSTRSVLIDVSENGGDVFFLSRQSLVAQDSGTEALVIYDARVNGGFAAISSPPACTTADACRTPVSPQPSLFGAPSSQTFSGAGNLAPPPPAAKAPVKSAKCKKGFVKKKVKGKYRCVRKPKRKAKSHKGGK